MVEVKARPQHEGHTTQGQRTHNPPCGASHLFAARQRPQPEQHSRKPHVRAQGTKDKSTGQLASVVPKGARRLRQGLSLVEPGARLTRQFWSMKPIPQSDASEHRESRQRQGDLVLGRLPPQQERQRKQQHSCRQLGKHPGRKHQGGRNPTPSTALVDGPQKRFNAHEYNGATERVGHGFPPKRKPHRQRQNRRGRGSQTFSMPPRENEKEAPQPPP